MSPIRILANLFAAQKLLYEGTILQQGTPAELAADEDVRTKYLGSGFILKRSVSVERAKAEYEKMNTKTE